MPAYLNIGRTPGNVEHRRGLLIPGDPLGVPSEWIRRFAHLVPAKTPVLDLAAGGGRHTRFFADRQHPVTSVDRVLDGMRDLAGRDGVSLVKLDLEAAPFPFETGAFGALVVTRYLHRPLLPLLPAALMPGGVLLYETFAQGNEAYGRPSDPNYLLAPGELLDCCRDRLTVVAYEHGTLYTPRPSVIQRVAAAKDRSVLAL